MAISKPTRNITLEGLLKVQPYGNTIDVVELKGQTILDVLEHSVSRVKQTTLFGGFLRVSGMKIAYNISQPVNHRVIQVKMLCAKCKVPEFWDLYPNRVYQVLMPSFVYKGGDGFTMIKDNIIKLHLTNLVDWTVLRNYVQSVSPLNTYKEGRIRIVDPGHPKYCL